MSTSAATIVKELEPIQRLSRDLKRAAFTLSADEARFLVDHYYTIQSYRLRAGGQIRALTESQEPHEVLVWFASNADTLEAQIKRALEAYAQIQKPGEWAMSIVGIGPVIAAGLLAHINIERAPTAGAIWKYAGLVPGVKWEKGQVRPWNSDLKVLTYKIGESFVKFQNHQADVYGRVYATRKELEIANNDAGMFADQAAQALASKNFGRETDARAWYEQGKLPPAHIHRRATRYATKLFLAAYHTVAYFSFYERMPPNPYPIQFLGHGHLLGVPNAEIIPGLDEAQRKLGAQPLHKGAHKDALKTPHPEQAKAIKPAKSPKPRTKK